MNKTMLRMITIVMLSGLAFSATYTVTNTNDSGPGSLRQAIIDANNNVGSDIIDFNVPGPGPFTVQPLTALPYIEDPVTIDGTSQPSYGGSPIIEIDGSLIGEANGLEIPAGHSTIKGLVINNCAAAGIYLYNNGGNTIQGNYLGIDVTGTIARNNHLSGIHLMDVPNNVIGGSTPESRNVISGNNLCGIWIEHPNATGNIIQGNYIGITADGSAALGNGAFGIKIRDAEDNKIGGSLSGEGNIISGNGWYETPGSGWYGIVVEVSANNTSIQGNYIGTDATGLYEIANVGSGIFIKNSNNALIGGNSQDARNIISGNLGYGIRIRDNSSNNNIQGNYIGTDRIGTAGIPNLSAGIYISQGASYNTIGGTDLDTGNLISGNNRAGVYIGFGANNNTVQGNLIGTDKTGQNPLGNVTTGISIFQDANDNIVGGNEEGAGNIIAFNNGVGILLDNDPYSIHNQFSRNSIFSNGDIGIDLSLSTEEPFTDGVTLNDPGDLDVGPNGLMNFPVITYAVAKKGKLKVRGTIDCQNPKNTTIELFINTTCDPSGYGEGEIYLGSTKPNKKGKFHFKMKNIPTGMYVSTTATDYSNNTSEFSNCVEISTKGKKK